MERALPAIVFADLDETFLATDKSIPALNAEALDVMARRGVAFVPCTGRAVTAVPTALMEHPATRCAIGSNGAVVSDCACRPIRTRLMEAADVLKLYELTRVLDVTFDVFVDGRVWAERWRYEAMGSFGLPPDTLKMLREVRRPTDLSVPEILSEGQQVEKVTAYYGDTTQRDAFVRAARSIDSVRFTSSHATNIEVMAEGVSKGEAMAWVCLQEGIDLSRAIAFGDSPNDMTMLEYAGAGIAMADSSPEVLAIADDVCGSNNDGGVGRYLLDLLVR